MTKITLYIENTTASDIKSYIEVIEDVMQYTNYEYAFETLQDMRKLFEAMEDKLNGLNGR